jgi:hypothetical protein
MYVEEICLSADVDDLEAGQPPEDYEKAAVLEQASWMRRCRSEFTLFSNQHLSVKTRGLMHQARDYTIDIGILDPHPKRSLKIGWCNLLIGVALCGGAWLFAFTGLKLNTPLLSILLGTCAGLSLLVAIYRSHDRLVLYSQYGRVPLVVLFNRSPDRATFDSFTGALVKHIEDAKARYPGVKEMLSEELKEHRRLMEEGVISSKRYDIVKQRILSQHSQRNGVRADYSV